MGSGRVGVYLFETVSRGDRFKGRQVQGATGSRGDRFKGLSMGIRVPLPVFYVLRGRCGILRAFLPTLKAGLCIPQ